MCGFEGSLYSRVGSNQGNTVVSENNTPPSTKCELKVHLAFEEVIKMQVAISNIYLNAECIIVSENNCLTTYQT